MSNHIDPRDTFALGVGFYADHWPRERWEIVAAKLHDENQDRRHRYGLKLFPAPDFDPFSEYPQ